MNQSPLRNLITTKNASTFSGYSSDYLARAARSGELKGEKVGRKWMIDRDSLNVFLNQQRNRRVEYARILAREREAEYRAHQPTIHPALASVPTPHHASSSQDLTTPFYSHAFALSAAVFVFICSAFVSQTSVIPSLARGIEAAATAFSSSVNHALQNMPSLAMRENTAAEASLRAGVIRADQYRTSTLANLALPLFPERILTPLLASDAAYHTVFKIRTFVAHVETITSSESAYEQFRLTAISALAAVSSPSAAAGIFMEGYYTLGMSAYRAIQTLLAWDVAGIRYAGAASLTFAGITRGAVIAAPEALYTQTVALSHFVNTMNLAFGATIIDGTHAAINTDVFISFALSGMLPSVGHTVLTALTNTGALIAGAMARASIFVLHDTGASGLKALANAFTGFTSAR